MYFASMLSHLLGNYYINNAYVYRIHTMAIVVISEVHL